MKISVIVPFYNAIRTLPKTLDSLKSQNAKEIEFILVDNASTDGSEIICKELAQSDSRFHYILEPRKGVSAARNIGIKKATGQCICFCDADDLPQPEMYQKLCEDLIRQDVDMVMCNYYSQRDEQISCFPNVMNERLVGEDVFEKLIPGMFASDGELAIWGTVWRCAFKKNIINENGIVFDEKMSFAEDLYFVLSYLRHVNAVYLEKENLYFYAYVKDSAMLSYGKFKKELFSERMYLIQKLQNILQEMNVYSKNKQEVNAIFQAYILECVGNASIKSEENDIINAFFYIKRIVDNPLVHSVFCNRKPSSRKKRIVYYMIYKKMAVALLIYYRIRRR